MRKGFKFNGKHTSEFGCSVKSFRVMLPSMKISKVSIPGQHGHQVINNGKYNNREIKLKLFLERDSQSELRRDLRYISSWLSNRGKSSQLRFDDDDELYYEGYLYDSIIPDIVGTACEFTVIFDCKPFLKSDSVKVSKQVNGSGQFLVVNNGTMDHSPLIEIEGTADSITLASDGGSLVLTNLTKKTYIDMDNDICYMIDEFGQKTNKLDDLQGNMIIPPGSMNISITGQNVNAKVSIHLQDVFI